MIPNISLDCSYVVLHFWSNYLSKYLLLLLLLLLLFEPRCSYKIVLIKKKRVVRDLGLFSK